MANGFYHNGAGGSGLNAGCQEQEAGCKGTYYIFHEGYFTRIITVLANIILYCQGLDKGFYLLLSYFGGEGDWPANLNRGSLIRPLETAVLKSEGHSVQFLRQYES
jgi:hypothetical protein